MSRKLEPPEPSYYLPCPIVWPFFCTEERNRLTTTNPTAYFGLCTCFNAACLSDVLFWNGFIFKEIYDAFYLFFNVNFYMNFYGKIHKHREFYLTQQPQWNCHYTKYSVSNCAQAFKSVFILTSFFKCINIIAVIMQFFSVLCVIRLKHMTGIGQLQTPHILRSFCHSMNPTGSDHLSPIIPAQNIN